MTGSVVNNCNKRRINKGGQTEQTNSCYGWKVCVVSHIVCEQRVREYFNEFSTLSLRHNKGRQVAFAPKTQDGISRELFFKEFARLFS